MMNTAENTKNGADRRMFERIPLDLPLRFKNNTQDREGRGFFQDISAAGAGIFSKEKVEIKDRLDLWLELPDRYEPLRICGEVVWVKETQPQVWRTGIQFSDIHLMDLSMILRAAPKTRVEW